MKRCIITTFNNTYILVLPLVNLERIPDSDVDDAELTKAFNARFVCIRERDLEKQQRLEKIGAIAVYNTSVDNLCATYNNLATKGRAPISD